MVWAFLRKQFFFEKKNQKTFICFGIGRVYTDANGARHQTDNSFLVLFFKKELLSYARRKGRLLLDWLFVNVLAPVFLPLILLFIAKGAPAGRRLQLMDPLKDGQLCWFAITLSCSTFYELMQNDASSQRVHWCGYAMAGMAMIGLFSGVYAVVAAIQTTPLLPVPAAGPVTLRAWLSHYTVFLTSLALSTGTALASLVIHKLLPHI